MKLLREGRLHRKIIVSSIAVILILMAIVQFLYSISYSSMFRQIVRTGSAQCRITMAALENEMLHLNYLQANIVENTQLKTLAYYRDTLTQTERLNLYNGISDFVAATSLFSRYVENIFIVLIGNDNEENEVLTVQGMVDYNKEDISYFLQRESSYRLISRNNDVYCQIKDCNVMDRERVCYSVLVKISAIQLSKQLNGILDQEGTVAALVFEDGGLTLSNSTNIKTVKETIQDGHVEEEVEMDGEKFILTKAYSETLGVSIYKFTPTQQLLFPLRSLQRIFILFAFMCGLVCVWLCFKTKSMIRKPLEQMLVSFQDVERGNLNHKIYHKGNDEFGEIFQHYNDMLDHLSIAIAQMNEYAVLKERAEFKQLQTQIDPHFLYNSFYVERRMLKMEDYEALDQMIHHLSQYFEYLHNASDDDLPLWREMEHAKNYLSIQQIRFKERICVQWEEVEEQWRNFPVPRLIIQPLLENAYKYSLEEKLSDGKISISYQYGEQHLFIVVEDNGDCLSEEKIEELNQRIQMDNQAVSALTNINRRLKIRYGDRSGIFLELASNKSGLRAIEKIYWEGEKPCTNY